MVYTHIPFLGIPSHPGTKVISPLSHLAKPPPQLFPEQYDRQMQGHFSPSHEGLFGRKDPYSPWPGSAVGQGRASLIAPPLQFCSQGTVASPSPKPSICLSIPLGTTTLSQPHDTVQGSFL